MINCTNKLLECFLVGCIPSLSIFSLLIWVLFILCIFRIVIPYQVDVLHLFTFSCSTSCFFIFDSVILRNGSLILSAIDLFFSSAVCAFYHHDWEITTKYIIKPLPHIFSEDGFNSYIYVLKHIESIFALLSDENKIPSLACVFSVLFIWKLFSSLSLKWAWHSLVQTEGDVQLIKSLSTKYQEPRSISRTHKRKYFKHKFKISALGRWRKEDSWSSMARQPDLL